MEHVKNDSDTLGSTQFRWKQGRRRQYSFSLSRSLVSHFSASNMLIWTTRIGGLTGAKWMHRANRTHDDIGRTWLKNTTTAQPRGTIWEREQEGSGVEKERVDTGQTAMNWCLVHFEMRMGGRADWVEGEKRLSHLPLVLHNGAGQLFLWRGWWIRTQIKCLPVLWGSGLRVAVSQGWGLDAEGWGTWGVLWVWISLHSYIIMMM